MKALTERDTTFRSEKQEGIMPIRQLDPNNPGWNEYWKGNNAAFRCPVCGKVYLVNSTRMFPGQERMCAQHVGS